MRALCSARLLRPLLRVAGAQGNRDLVPSEWRAADPDDRIPVDAVHSSFERAVERMGDEQLGLKLGRSVRLGEMGSYDYLVRSAPTVREAAEAAARYSVLHADGYRVFFETWHGRALVRLVDENSWPRPVADLAMTTTYRHHVCEGSRVASPVECWFPYAKPRDMRAYEEIFDGAVLKFEAPFYAFAFDGARACLRQPTADPMLHALLRDRLDAVMAEVSRTFGLRQRVRRAIEQQIREHRDASAPRVASALRMSRRTLSRRLEQDGTTFGRELDDVRRELALSYMRESQRPLAEVAFLLGFAHVESFHRAFKRWTGGTPSASRGDAGTTTTKG